MRLGAINELQNKFPDAIVGLSDHTSNYTSLASVALGGSIIERRFTDKTRPGPDIVCSMNQTN